MGGKLDLVINVPDSMDSQSLSDGFEMRRAAVDSGTSLIVDIKTAILVVVSLHRKYSREQAGKEFFSLKSWQGDCAADWSLSFQCLALDCPDALRFRCHQPVFFT